MASTKFDLAAFEAQCRKWDVEDDAHAASNPELTPDERDLTAPPGFADGGVALRDVDTSTFL